MADEVDLVKRLRARSEKFKGFAREALSSSNASLWREVAQEADDTADELSRLRASIAIKDKALREVEWSGGTCPCCGFKQQEGHESDPKCELAQALHTAERKGGVVICRAVRKGRSWAHLKL